VLTMAGGKVATCSIGLTNLAETALLAEDAAAAVIGTKLDDASLNRAKRGRHRVRLVRRADDDQPIEEVRISLGECESDHAAVRRADDGFDLVDADLVERGNNGVSLVMRADNSLRTPVDSASAVDEVAADELKLRRIERTTSPRDRLPPAGRGIDAVGADMTVR